MISVLVVQLQIHNLSAESAKILLHYIYKYYNYNILDLVFILCFDLRLDRTEFVAVSRMIDRY